MNLNKSLSLLSVIVVLLAVNCKKGKEGEETNNSSDSAIVLNLNGSPAQNLITVFEAGITALESNADNPGAAASSLGKILSSYDVADLRDKARQAKEAGQGATEQEKNQLATAMAKYKKLAAEVGSKDPGAFNDVHTKWSAAFGVK